MSDKLTNLSKFKEKKLSKTVTTLDPSDLDPIDLIYNWVDTVVEDPTNHPTFVASMLTEGTEEFNPDRAFILLADGDNLFCFSSDDYLDLAKKLFQPKEDI